MKERVFGFAAAIVLLAAAQLGLFAQTAGSIAGTVVDSNGAVVPGAGVLIKDAGGQEFSATTSDNGTYRVPAVQAGIYVVTVKAPNFKTSVVQNVKVDVGTPATVNITLQAGDVKETVTVTGGGEVLQTQTATVGASITGRQIVETPVPSRDALDLIGLLPGTATVGRPRTATIDGLPKGALTITLDGVDIQANDARSSDGYFTYVRPRVDAIDEVTVSTANPGAESSGDGAVQIKFVTKRGTNDYHGGLFFQHRNEALNANYWYLNRNPPVSLASPTGLDDNGKALRQKIRLFQYGGNASGPIPLPRFGDGDNGWFDSGKDKRFFFVNYEEFRLPQSLSRTRKVLTPDAQAGIYKYRASAAGFATLPNTPTTTCVPFGTGQMECSVDVYKVAAAQAADCNPNVAGTQPCPSVADPTVAAMFNKIRSSLSGIPLLPITANPNLLDYNFNATSSDVRKFLTMRFDVNVTKKHSVEFVINRQSFDSSPDLLNGREGRFPGYKGYSQISDRNSWTVAVRSTLAQNIVNEARYAVQEGGPTVFFGELSAADFDEYGGYNITSAVTLGGTASTSPISTTSIQNSKTPVYDLTDSATWIKGSHSINFGGEFKRIVAIGDNIDRFVPSVSFGILSTDTVPQNMFTTCSSSTFTAACRVPGGGSTQQSELRNLYALMTGRVSGFTDTAYLDTAAGTYSEAIPRHRVTEQRSYGLFIQDNWRIKPNLSVNYGVRWQPQTGFVAKTFGNYTKLESPDQVYGLSGAGNLFKPGTLTGSAPRVVPVEVGESVYPTDWNNFAPTVGVVWSPDFGDKHILRTLFGRSGQSVFRGGYSVSFVREGTNLLELINGANPGGTLSLSRSTSVAGSLTVGTNFSDPNNPNLTPLPGILGTNVSFPIALGPSDSTNSFNPNIKTGQVTSFSFGYQRELDKNTVIEVRYVGDKGTGMQRQININEFNTIENGFAAEFVKAQQNLYLNIAAGKGSTFAYFADVPGSNQLPIMLAYFNTKVTYDPANPARYAAANFTNSALVAALSRNNPNVGAFNTSNFEADAQRRINAVANGLPINFFYVNPTTISGGSWLVENTNESWYNSAVIEVRRRLSSGLRFNANYVFSKAMANAFTSDAEGGGGLPPTVRDFGYDLARNVQISDIRHQFKFEGTYDLPFGSGRQFFAGANPVVKQLIGGWSIAPVVRWQSGAPINLGNVQLVGMDRKELQKAIKVRKEADQVYWLPDDIILNTQKAFDISVANTNTNGGYGTQFGTGGPQGRFIAPAGYGNCVSTYGGQCGFSRLVVYGPGFFKFDASLAKTTRIGERARVELRATVLDVLNHPNFRVTSWSGDTASPAIGGSTFGQLPNGAAYQDTSTTNDPGGRLIDIIVRFIF